MVSILVPSLSAVNFTVRSISSKIFCKSFILVSTPDKEILWPCYNRSGKSVLCNNFSDLGTLLSHYQCGICAYEPNESLSWPCLSLSESLDIHPGMHDYMAAMDMVIHHVHRVASTCYPVSRFVMSSGTVLTNFTATGNGVLSSVDCRRVGHNLVLIAGRAQHTTVYVRRNYGGMCEWNYPKPNFARLRTATASLILLLNPKQDLDMNCGRLFLNFNPTVKSTWLTPFVSSWSTFVLRNPKLVVTALYVTADGVYFGSPTDNAVSYRLSGYHGLPILLSYYRDRLATLYSSVLVTGAMRATDTEADVPHGKYFCFFLFFIFGF